jgi:hypothetical protein
MDISKLILESSNEIIEIEKLTNQLLDFIVENNFQIIYDLKTGKDIKDIIFPVNEFYVIDSIKMETLSRIIKPFLRQRELKIKIVNNLNVTALYNNDTIFLNTNSNSFIKSLNNYINLKTKPKVILHKILFDSFKKSLHHELQHAIDDYKSDGLYIRNKRDIEFSNKYSKATNDIEFFDNKDNLELYHSIPSEINAKLTETLLSLNVVVSINEFIKNFKIKFKEFNNQNENIKRKLLKYAYKYYIFKNARKN